MNNNFLVKRKSAQQKSKEKNLSQIFNLIANNKGITRVEIAKKLGIAASTVSSLTEELTLNGLIKEIGMANVDQVGRKAICLQVNSLGGFFVCVQLKKGLLLVEGFNLNLKKVFYFSVQVSGILKSSELANIIEDDIQVYYKYGKFLGIIFIFPAWFEESNTWDNFYYEYGYRFAEDYLTKLKRYYSEIYVCQENSMTINSYCAAVESSQTSFYANCGEELLSCIISPSNLNSENIVVNNFGNVGINVLDCDFEQGRFGLIKEYLSIKNIIRTVNFNTGNNYNFNQIVEAYNNENEDVMSIIDEKAKYFAYALSSVIVLAGIKNIVVGGEIVALGEKFKDRINFYLSKINSDNRYNLSFYDDEKFTTQNSAKFLFNNVFNEENIIYYINS